MTKRGFCTKVMWEHHMTSPSFGGDFKEEFEMVAVQKSLQNLWKIIFKGIKLRKHNYAIKSTDKRNVFLRGYTSPTIFLESFHLRWGLHNIKEKRGSEIKKINPEIKI